MRTRTLVVSLFLLLAPLALFAQDDPSQVARELPGRFLHARHYILEPQHLLRDDERAAMAANGIDVQRVLPNGRYMVRVAEDADAAADPRVRSLTPLSPSMKLQRSAAAEAATLKPFARLNVFFHDDVTFEDARALVAAAGGTLEKPLQVDFDALHRVLVRVPTSNIGQLTASESVRTISGAQLKIGPLNAIAAQVSHVTPLFSAPYNLSGAGVALSLAEIEAVDTTHPEFSGRLTSHFPSSSSIGSHGTHVAGTIIAQGIRPDAKGMAPAATLHSFDASDPDIANIWNDKETKLSPLNIRGDNNSWGVILGWCNSPGCEADQYWVWTGNNDYFGAYDDLYVAPLDKLAIGNSALIMYSAGNDADGNGPTLPPYPHRHQNDSGTIKDKIFCYSADGSGNDCPTVCSVGAQYCEKVHHPDNGPYLSIGLISSAKNAVAVGAVDAEKVIASFSSRGPTRDGRVKPDIVAKGVDQYSTLPNNRYGTSNGTSMSSPVVTGISGLLTEQYRKTFNNQEPLPQTIKTLLIAGADDLGNPGPDYTYGFGLANAQASADLIIADQAKGNRIRVASMQQGGLLDIPVTITSTQKLRVVLGWFDPETVVGDDIDARVLVNDLDLAVIDPNASTVLPYVLDKNHPTANATRGTNNVDNVEEIEIANATPGTYHIFVRGTAVAQGPQQFVVVANANVGTSAPSCTDPYEPNNTQATAFGPVTSGQVLRGRICTGDDVDFYRVHVDNNQNVHISIAAAAVPLRVTVTSPSVNTKVFTVAAQTTFATDLGSDINVTGPVDYYIQVTPNGLFTPPSAPITADGSYVLTMSWSGSPTPNRRRAAGH